MSGEDADLVARAQARVGTTIGGKYRVDRILGIGGMAAVFGATHRNGHRVALKLLNPDLSARADMRVRFRREGQAANTVNHPGAVVVIDDDVAEDGSAYLVMELLTGDVVEKIWEKHGQRLSAAFVLALARELCGVLSAAHRVGIVHRDLKPENLFLTSDNKLKVLDFGLAQLRDATRPKDTHTGMIFGTPAFMPPEQARGRTSQIDARTDLWAVGAAMFTLLSGAMVHQAETAQDFVVRAATEPARSLAEALPSAHPELAALVDRALSYDRAERWQTADAMCVAIRATSRAILGDADVPLVVPATPTDPELEDTTRIDNREAPLIDTVPDEEKTKIGRPAELDSSAERTEPKARAPAIAMALRAPVVLKGAPALALSSDTPTTEREQADRVSPTGATTDDDVDPPVSESETVIARPEYEDDDEDEDEEDATRVRAPQALEDAVDHQVSDLRKRMELPRQPVTQPALTAVRVRPVPPNLSARTRFGDATAPLPPNKRPVSDQTLPIGPPTPARWPTHPSIRQSTGIAVSLPPTDRASYVPVPRPPRAAPTLRKQGARKVNVSTLAPWIAAAAFLLATPIMFFLVRASPSSDRAVTPVAEPTIKVSAVVRAPRPPSLTSTISTTPPDRSSPSAVAASTEAPTPTIGAPAPAAAPPSPSATNATTQGASDAAPVVSVAAPEPTASADPCKPPFTLDAAGIKHWKVGCFSK